MRRPRTVEQQALRDRTDRRAAIDFACVMAFVVIVVVAWILLMLRFAS